jgi:hypothetical protein
VAGGMAGTAWRGPGAARQGGETEWGKEIGVVESEPAVVGGWPLAKGTGAREREGRE